jgi:flavin reductase (DIM6/NTAB) family NADH-FMN oxidoreductase RutF
LPLVSIPIEAFTTRSYSIWEHGWFLLTSGDFAAGKYNTMTVSWGGFGCMWARPYAQVVVRPQRYTFEFIEAYPTFTLCAFPKSRRKALDLLGTKSGRGRDKIAEAGLTPMPAVQVEAPVFAEAELVIECRKLYWQDIDPAHFLAPGLDKNYPRSDYHRIYYGEILAVRGVPAYLAA